MLVLSQEQLLKELAEVHSEQRSAIWELAHQVEKTTEKIQGGCSFVDRVLQHGSSVEMLAMKRLIANQLLTLINNTPKLDMTVKLQFRSDAEKFEQAIKDTFGQLNGEKKAEPEVRTRETPYGITL